MRRIAGFALLCLLGTTAVFGQETLSLEAAVLKALENNFDIRIARKGEAIAAVNNTLEATGLFPAVVLNGSNNNTVTDNSQNPTAFIQDQLNSTSFAGSAALDWTLFNGFQVWINRDRLQLLEEQSGGNTALVVENTVQAVILAYWNAVLQAELLALNEEVTGLSSDRLKYAQDNRALGISTTYDVVQARSALLSDTTQVLQQRLAVDDARRNLNVLMAVPLETAYLLSTPMALPTESPSLADMQARMDTANTSLKLQYFDNRLLEQDLRLAKAARYPALSFQSGWSQTQSSFTVGDLSGDGKTLNYYANFTLSFTLYGGGAVRRNIEVLQINEAIRALTTAELKQSLQQQLRSNAAQFNAQRELVNLAAQNVADAQLALELSEDRWRTGLINAFNYRDAQVAYLNAQYSYLLNLFNALNTEAALRKLTGELVR